MESKSRKHRLQAGSALACVFPLLISGQSKAAEFSFLDNQVTGSLDTTVSYGALWRVQRQDKTNNDVNSNDGNRNFSPGLASEVYKITSDLGATYENYGLFVRGSAFYDTQIMDKRNNYYEHNQPPQPSQSYPQNDRFTNDTRDIAGSRMDILDAYVYGNWDIAEHSVTARLGRQVFNWGESLFYRGGVNTTNPVDSAKFRLPGSEVKEVLLPVEAISFNIGLTDNLSLDTFYQFKWKETQLDPVGTFFSETDLFAEGGNTGYTRVNAFANPTFQRTYQQLSASHFAGLQGTQYLDPNGYFKVSDIGNDISPKDDGQFGAAFHYIAEQLNSTEFGFYFVNYHSKDPVIYADLNPAYTGINMNQLAGAGGFSSYNNLIGAAGAGNAGANQTLGLVNGIAAVDVANQITAKRQYMENIQMYGLSFNTNLGNASIFGEVAYRPNLPIGIATTNDLLGDLLAQAGQLASGRAVNVGGKMVSLGGMIEDSTRVQAYNSSLGSIYNFGPALSFNSLMGVIEVAAEQLRGSSLQYTAYNGTTRYYSGRSNLAYVSGGDRSDQVNRNAYGATVMVTGTWNDLFAGVNVSPFAVYKDDFSGNSSQSGNFIAGRKAYTLGVKANYMNSLEGELQYTSFYGAGQENAARDRDNVGFNVKYSF